MSRSIILLIAVCTFCGCGKDEGESLSKRTGNKVGEVLTDFTTGVGRGIDNQMIIDIELSPRIKELGLSRTIAKTNGLDVEKSISIYLISEHTINETMILKVYDKNGQEIGRSSVDVAFGDDDAKYVTFVLQEETDMQLIDKYYLDQNNVPTSHPRLSVNARRALFPARSAGRHRGVR